MTHISKNLLARLSVLSVLVSGAIFQAVVAQAASDPGPGVPGVVSRTVASPNPLRGQIVKNIVLRGPAKRPRGAVLGVGPGIVNGSSGPLYAQECNPPSIISCHFENGNVAPCRGCLQWEALAGASTHYN
jgi:hypothetical protein